MSDTDEDAALMEAILSEARGEEAPAAPEAAAEPAAEPAAAVAAEPEAEAAPAPAEPEKEAPAPGESVEDRARRFGWRPKEEWKTDPKHWIDAAEFVERAERMPGTVRRLEAELKAQAEATEAKFAAFSKMAEAQRERAVKDAEARAKTAEENFDFAGYKAAMEDKAALEQQPAPPPQDDGKAKVDAWFEANPRVRDNPLLRKMLSNLGGDAAQRGIYGAEAQLRYAEDVLRLNMPGVLGVPQEAAPPPSRTPAPAARPAAAAVDGGGLVQPGGKRAVGWDDLAGEDRGMLQELIDMGVFKDRKEALADHLKIFPKG